MSPDLTLPDLTLLTELCAEASVSAEARVLFESHLSEALRLYDTRQWRPDKADRALLAALVAELATMVMGEQDPNATTIDGLFAKALDLAPADQDPEIRATILTNAFSFHANQQVGHAPSHAMRADLLEEGVRLGETLGDHELAALAYTLRGMAELPGPEFFAPFVAPQGSRKHRVRALDDFDAARAHARLSGDIGLEWAAHLNVAAIAASLVGDAPGAEETAMNALAQAQTIARESADAHAAADVEHGFGLVHLALSEPDDAGHRRQAIKHLRAALAIRSNGSPQKEAETLVALGVAHARRPFESPEKDLDTARTFLESALLTYVGLEQHEREASRTRCLLATVAADRAALSGAPEDLRRALQMFESARRTFAGDETDFAYLTLNFHETLLASDLPRAAQDGAAFSLADLDAAINTFRNLGLPEYAERARRAKRRVESQS